MNRALVPVSLELMAGRIFGGKVEIVDFIAITPEGEMIIEIEGPQLPDPFPDGAPRAVRAIAVDDGRGEEIRFEPTE